MHLRCANLGIHKLIIVAGDADVAVPIVDQGLHQVVKKLALESNVAAKLYLEDGADDVVEGGVVETWEQRRE